MKNHELLDKYTALFQDNYDEVAKQKDEVKHLVKECEKLQDRTPTSKTITKALKNIANELDLIDHRLDAIDDELDDLDDALDDLEDTVESVKDPLLNVASKLLLRNHILNSCKTTTNNFVVNGKKIPFPEGSKGHNISVINGVVHCDGYTFNTHTGEWEK